MAQAYEYKVVQTTNADDLGPALATEDADGWDVAGYSSTWTGGSGANVINWSVLLRRRI